MEEFEVGNDVIPKLIIPSVNFVKVKLLHFIHLPTSSYNYYTD